jgi:hypothetical protein
MAFLAVKGVTYHNLIRLGVLWGKGPGVYKKGAFGQSWGCLSMEEIRELHEKLCEKLKDCPFSPFDALTLLIGEKNAREFSGRDRLNLTTRALRTPSIAS